MVWPFGNCKTFDDGRYSRGSMKASTSDAVAVLTVICCSSTPYTDKRTRSHICPKVQMYWYTGRGNAAEVVRRHGRTMGMRPRERSGTTPSQACPYDFCA